MTRKPSILVLDDQMLAALDVASMLEQNGFDILGPFANIKDAMAQVAHEMPDAALLDINMGDGTTSAPLADVLLDQNLPFAFITGYGSAGVLPERFSGIQCLSKPVEPNALVSTAKELVALRG